MRYEWVSILETGNSMIDNHHKQLFNTLNELMEMEPSPDGRAELEHALEFLNAYIVKHFSDEESLMDLYRYPDGEYHRRYHREFTETVRIFTKRLLSEGASRGLLDEVGESVANWLLHHIKGDDFKLAAYVKAAPRRAS